jgi:hypothetical protein
VRIHSEATGTTLRPLAAVALLAALALSMAALVRPVTVSATTSQVWLQVSHQGSDSETFTEDEDCGDFETGVVWHFILNQYSGPAAHLVADFESAGTLETDASKVLQNTQHFYLNTPGDDVLENAYAEVEGDAGTANLVLSHVCHTGSESTPTPTPTPTATPTASPTASPTPEGSVGGSTSTPSPTTEGSVQGGTGTPAPSQPDTAMGVQGGPSPIPTAIFALILLAALGTLAWANVKSSRSRA